MNCETLKDVTCSHFTDGIIDVNEKEHYENEVENINEYLNTFFKDIEVLKSEFPFTIEKNNYIINGQINLIYKRNGAFNSRFLKINRYLIKKN